MAVKHGLLAILTLGPAYGLQLRDELVARAPHRNGINVGQVYGTLERLRKAGLVVEAGTTLDGLQRYGLTSSGRTAAAEWMRASAQGASLDWSEMLDQVLVVSSIPDAPIDQLIRSYRDALAPASPERAESQPRQRQVADSATLLLLDAARQWIDEAARSLSTSAAFELSNERPRRGRRATLS
ncbi:PadR family transcriptional regulator [Paramicrobacterium agarici]|uniref:PadR family transcriptional regulator n=1 Tax=Paramicrobacterium agarici TaxID=630514 RepID=UPI00116FFFFA|nr:PadR family transcriptional regulator [Microbacterium agarici]TQO24337.1 PadR family transcriptional regulator [Microbacterium agarici]